MAARDYSKLIAELTDEYTKKSPRSKELNDTAKQHLVDGGSHNLRLSQPFPPRIVTARGGWIQDEDGNDILDFWQGHLANVLGHNPEVVTSELARAFSDRIGLQGGFVDRLQAEVAEILCARTGAEQVRLTTSGTLADMYSVMLSRTFTGREMVLKAGGGWHGAQPWSLKGFGYKAEGGVGFQGLDTEGIPKAVTDDVVVTAYNDCERLREDMWVDIQEHLFSFSCLQRYWTMSARSNVTYKLQVDHTDYSESRNDPNGVNYGFFITS